MPGFYLEPIGLAAAAVERVLPLDHDPFQTELAGVPEYSFALLPLDMVVKPNAVACPRDDVRQRGLAELKRVTPQVVTVQFNQVEGVQNPLASFRQ